MTHALASDITITWLSAIGTGLYFHFLWRRRESGPAVKATLFLMGVLMALLAVRGFFWLWGGAALGRLVFIAATLLPIAVTLFTEHLLRRHHPRWLKLVALSVSVVFGLVNLVADLSSNAPLLLAFLAGFVLTMIGNVWLMLRASQEDLAPNEVRVVHLLVIAVAAATVLAVTDFREELPGIPVRLGALGPLLFVCVLLNQTETSNIANTLGLKPALGLLFAAVLASALALSTQGLGPGFIEAAWRGLPVAIAWILLTVVIVRIGALSAANPGNLFLRWLLHARLDTAEGFIYSLRKLAQTEGHVVLGPEELAGYSTGLLFEAGGTRREPLALSDARSWLRKGEHARLDAAEQLIDLLERHEMTHALLISPSPPLIVLLNLPQGANAAVGQLRAGVIQRLARRLAEGSGSHD